MSDKIRVMIAGQAQTGKKTFVETLIGRKVIPSNQDLFTSYFKQDLPYSLEIIKAQTPNDFEQKYNNCSPEEKCHECWFFMKANSKLFPNKQLINVTRKAISTIIIISMSIGKDENLIKDIKNGIDSNQVIISIPNNQNSPIDFNSACSQIFKATQSVVPAFPSFTGASLPSKTSSVKPVQNNQLAKPSQNNQPAKPSQYNQTVKPSQNKPSVKPIQPLPQKSFIGNVASGSKSDLPPEYLNILVIGKKGAGKTFIIRTVLHLPFDDETDKHCKIEVVRNNEVNVKCVEFCTAKKPSEYNDIVVYYNQLKPKDRFHYCWYVLESSFLTGADAKYINELLDLNLNVTIIVNKMRNENSSDIREIVNQFGDKVGLAPICDIAYDGNISMKGFFDQLLCMTANTIAPNCRTIFNNLIKYRNECLKAEAVNEHEQLDIKNVRNAVQKGGLSRLNILVVGATGAGKSTLINSVIGSKVAVEGTGKSITMEIKAYDIPNCPITIYDSRGFELSNLEMIMADIYKLIDNSLKQSDESKRIHVVWYCVNAESTRLEEFDIKFIESIAKQRKIPVFLVLTRSIDKNFALEKFITNPPTPEDIKNKTLRLQYPSAKMITQATPAKRAELIAKNVVVKSILARAYEYNSIPPSTMAPFGISDLLDLHTVFLQNRTQDIINAFKKKKAENLSNLEKCTRESNLGHINIILVGKTGCGKSTLINTIFDLPEEEKAKTAVGMSQTMEIKEYSFPGKPMTLFDTRGFELGKFEMIKQMILDKIAEKKESINPRDHIHILWYCVNSTGERIEEGEKDFIDSIKKEIPVFIVITKCFDKFNKLFEETKNIFKTIDYNTLVRSNPEIRKEFIKQNCIVHKVNTLEKDVDNGRVPQFGLNELLELHQFFLPQVATNAINVSQTNFINQKRVQANIKVEEYSSRIYTLWGSSSGTFSIIKSYYPHLLKDISDLFNGGFDEETCDNIAIELKRRSKILSKEANSAQHTKKFMIFGGKFSREKASNIIKLVGNATVDAFYSIKSIPDEITEDNFIEFAVNTLES